MTEITAILLISKCCYIHRLCLLHIKPMLKQSLSMYQCSVYLPSPLVKAWLGPPFEGALVYSPKVVSCVKLLVRWTMPKPFYCHSKHKIGTFSIIRWWSRHSICCTHINIKHASVPTIWESVRSFYGLQCWEESAAAYSLYLDTPLRASTDRH